ncbi:MAG: hypothetical protein ACO331_01355 [Prochlorothrix sp.]
MSNSLRPLKSTLLWVLAALALESALVGDPLNDLLVWVYPTFAF